MIPERKGEKKGDKRDCLVGKAKIVILKGMEMFGFMFNFFF